MCTENRCKRASVRRPTCHVQVIRARLRQLSAGVRLYHASNVVPHAIGTYLQGRILPNLLIDRFLRDGFFLHRLCNEVITWDGLRNAIGNRNRNVLYLLYTRVTTNVRRDGYRR